jgi:L-malate glycosyltransferase
MARRGMHGVDLVIAVSEGQRKRIQATFPRVKRSIVISNIVDTSLFSPSALPATTDGFTVLFVGLLDTDQKGLHVLLDALAVIKGKNKIRLQVDIVGDGALRKQYEAQALNLGISEMVRFHGIRKRDEVVQHMRQCHALVLPSLHEAAPVVIIEAHSSGRPIIATSCGGPEYMIDESNGKIVEPCMAEPLADAIIDVLQHLGRYNPETIAHDAAKRYGFEAITGALTDVYKEIIASD